MKKTRSPRFPFLPLEKAVENISTLKENDCITDFRPYKAMEALGFASMHGRAVKVFAALRAYDLIVRSPRAKKDERLFTLTENGLNILNSSQNPEEQLAFLQQAALSPMMFRGIWNRAKNATEDELQSRLLDRDFTESGAQRASRVYLKNSKFAALNDLESTPEGLPDRGPRPGRGKGAEQPSDTVSARQGGGLNLPLSTGRAIIPTGITEEEFVLLMQTLRLWKPRLIKKCGSCSTG